MVAVAAVLSVVIKNGNRVTELGLGAVLKSEELSDVVNHLVLAVVGNYEVLNLPSTCTTTCGWVGVKERDLYLLACISAQVDVNNVVGPTAGSNWVAEGDGQLYPSTIGAVGGLADEQLALVSYISKVSIDLMAEGQLGLSGISHVDDWRQETAYCRIVGRIGVCVISSTLDTIVAVQCPYWRISAYIFNNELADSCGERLAVVQSHGLNSSVGCDGVLSGNNTAGVAVLNGDSLKGSVLAYYELLAIVQCAVGCTWLSAIGGVIDACTGSGATDSYIYRNIVNTACRCEDGWLNRVALTGVEVNFREV